MKKNFKMEFDIKVEREDFINVLEIVVENIRHELVDKIKDIDIKPNITELD